MLFRRGYTKLPRNPETGTWLMPVMETGSDVHVRPEQPNETQTRKCWHSREREVDFPSTLVTLKLLGWLPGEAGQSELELTKKKAESTES